MLQALHDTQSEHSTQLRQHTALLDEHTTILKEHTAILSDHSGQLAEIRVGVQTIIDLLTPRPARTSGTAGSPPTRWAAL
jgi:hypothetical protein